MVKKANKTEKVSPTKKRANKKCPTMCKFAIIAVIAAAIVLAVALIFVMFIKGKKYTLTCEYNDSVGTNMQTVYSYGFDTSKPYNIYQLNEVTAASEEEASENAKLLQIAADEDELYMTTKSWSEGNKFYSENSRNQKQIKVALEDEEIVVKSLDDTKKEMEEYGFVCEVTR